MNKKIIPVGQYGHFIDIEAIIEAAKGNPGKSAYEIAVELGFEGDEKDWLETLKGVSRVDIVNSNNYAHVVVDDLTNVKYTPQKLSKYERDIARTNIGAANLDNVVEAFTPTEIASAVDETVVTEAVRVVPLTFTNELKAVAQQNIDVADESRVEALEINTNQLIKAVGNLSDLEVENKPYTSLVSAINLVASGSLKYMGSITTTTSTSTFSQLSPVKVGYLYNINGPLVTVNGLTVNDGDWVIAIADTYESEEPTFLKFGSN